MDRNKLERANIIAKGILPKISYLLTMPATDSVRIADSICGLLKCDETFKIKFKQLLNETNKRLQKEFDEL